MIEVMDMSQDISSIARLIGAYPRAQMLLALLEASPLTATELAHKTNVSPQTVSSHLSQLVQGNLLIVEIKGRNRNYRLAGMEIAQVLESLMVLSSSNLKRHKHLDLESLQFARLCYDHLAGKLGISLTESLVKQGWIRLINKHYEVTPQGRINFQILGIDVTLLEKHHLVSQCLDWSEKRYHISGPLAAALTKLFLECKWLIKDKQSRILHLTTEGQKGFIKVFGLKL